MLPLVFEPFSLTCDFYACVLKFYDVDVKKFAVCLCDCQNKHYCTFLPNAPKTSSYIRIVNVVLRRFVNRCILAPVERKTSLFYVRELPL